MKLLCGILMFVVIGVTAKAGDILPQPDRAEGPLQNYTPEAIAGAVKVRDTLAGTIWSYHIRDGEHEFGFGRAGELQLLESWKGVRWRVVSPREVILEGTGGDHMLLRFDSSLQLFWTRTGTARRPLAWAIRSEAARRGRHRPRRGPPRA